MERYIGVKVIAAEPMTLGAYNQFKGWTIPEDEDPNTEGFLVEYADNYISWSPKPAFEESYKRTDCLTFGLAIEALKKGFRVARQGWNGKGMWLSFVSAEGYTVGGARSGSHSVLPWIGMKTADDKFVPWLASQTDVLAEDWAVVE